jgi:hypothetical protein
MYCLDTPCSLLRLSQYCPVMILILNSKAKAFLFFFITIVVKGNASFCERLATPACCHALCPYTGMRC